MTRPRPPRLVAGLLVTAILGAPLVLGDVAYGAEDTVTFSDTVPVRLTDWTDTVTLPRFDPALGDLRAVDLSIDAHLDATMYLENLADTSASLATRLSAQVVASRPGPGGSAIAGAHPSVTRTDDLAAFDGTLDHAGASGQTANVTANQATTATLSDPADLTLFTGTGSITLPTAGTGTSIVPGGVDVDADVNTSVGASVTVTYTYVSDTRPPDPPTILSSPPAFTADPDPLVTFSAEPVATTECRLATPSSPGSWTACSSPWVGHLGPGDDGLSTFSVRAIDAAGNVGVTATASFTLDRVPPVQPVLTFQPPPLGQSPNPTWAFTVESGATARCSLDASPASACSSPFGADLTLAGDGPHTFALFAVDAAGNAGPPILDTYTLDRLAPAPPTITTPPATPGNDPTPSWGFELAADAATASCAVDGGPYTACGTSVTADLSAAADGAHTISVRNADVAGNQSLATTGTYELDRTAPGAPTILSPPSPSSVTNPVWGIAADTGGTNECRLDASSWVVCAGSYTTTFGPGSDGVHVLTVRATDAAGNRGPEATTTYALDTTAPAAPAITTSPADPSNSPTPLWAFTIEADSAATCSLDGGPWSPCTSPHQADLSSAADGRHELAVRATDAVGNVGPAAHSAFTLDRAAPAAPSITSAPDSPTSNPSVAWAFTTPDGTTTTCGFDGGTAMACIGSVAATFADDGQHRLEVIAIDSAGNASAPAVAVYTLDRLAPVAPMIMSSPTSPDRITTPQWTFVVEDLSAGECAIDDSPWVPCATSFSADLSSALDGPHTFAVHSVDAAGNVGAVATDTFVLDRTPPGVPLVTSAPPTASDDDTPTWTFVVDHGAAAWCRVDDGAWLPCDGTSTADLTTAGDGIHALEVRAIDAVGNEGTTTVSTYELDRLAPAPAAMTIVPLSPNNDPTPEWWFAYEPGTTAWCSIDAAAAAECDATVSATFFADGTHDVAIVVVDAAGNTSAPATNLYELDTIAPAGPTLSAPRSPDRDEEPDWGIWVEPGAVAECAFDGGAPVACGALFTVGLTGLEGTHRLSVVARDAAGNTSAAVASSYVLDTIAPAAPMLQHTPDRSSWTWRFGIEPGATAECSIDGGPWSSCASPLPGGTPDKTVRFEVRAVDRAGNRSTITDTTVTLTTGAATPTPATGGPPPATPPPTTPGAGATVGEPVGTDAVTRPSVSARAPSGRGDAEVDVGALLRRLRPEEGPFSGPVGQLLQAAAKSTTIPVLVVLIVLSFVAVQNRIDRRDPKLADAPLRNEPEYLEFH